MSSILSINIDNLIRCVGVETARVEFKAVWDKKVTPYQIVKTICAFANDFQNLNGGYIVLGVAETNGCAILPPQGISPQEIDEIQRQIRGVCKRIEPDYPVVISPELIDGKYILVLWVPASDVRPHSAPDGEKGIRKYFVRIGSETIDAAKNGFLDQLLQMTARVPFDDRRALAARVEDIRENKVREFLKDIRSGLLDEENARELYRKLKIAVPVNGHDAPKNIGLLFFGDDVTHWFPCCRIEIVHYSDGAAGNIIEERVFQGGIHEQLRGALSYLEGMSSAHLEKQENTFRLKGWVSYPVPALREALVNAVYHRSYESDYPDPVKVYLYPDRIEVISYPGPLPGIHIEHLRQEKPIPPLPARNRRIGEFLKELRLAEGRGTGIPKLYRAMRDNGSDDPRFDYDEGRSYFRVTLPAHPEYVAIAAFRDAAHLRAIGDEGGAFRRIEETWQRMMGSPSLTAEMIRLLGEKNRVGEATKTYEKFIESSPVSLSVAFVTNVLINALLNADKKNEAAKLLDQLPQYLADNDALDAAILARRLGKQKNAHRYFERAGGAVFYDVRALLEFAQTKMALAREQYGQGKIESNKRLLKEALELLERVVQMEADHAKHGWAWYDLSRVRAWLKMPKEQVEEAYRHAKELLPDEGRFRNPSK